MTTPRSQASDRVLALQQLLEWVNTGTPPSETESWQEGSALSREMVWTCIRHQTLLDAWIDHVSRTPPRHPVRAALWIGVSQILLLDGIAPHAAVHETIEAAKSLDLPSSVTGFLNALLRRIVREKKELLEWREEQPLSDRLSHPTFLLNRWMQTFGEEETERLCLWNQQRSQTFARYTHLSPSGLPDLELELETLPDVPGFVRLPRGLRVNELPDFQNGHWYIQDPSTRIAPTLLNVSPGEHVWDACAAPGGKTAILAEQMGDQAHHLLASDPNPKRLRRLRENLQRLGHNTVDIKQLDPVRSDLSALPLFDAILLDVPCSNTGVLQRRPDAKWGLKRKTLSHLAGLQYDILKHASHACKPGGRVVYSTCSIEPEETRDLISRWCKQQPDWSCEEETLLLPGKQNCDGCYAARLVKQA